MCTVKIIRLMKASHISISCTFFYHIFKKTKGTQSYTNLSKTIVLFDNFKGQLQCTEEMIKFLDSNEVNTVLIPPNCTERLQSLDISVNNCVKEFLCQNFHSWYADSVSTQLGGLKPKKPVNLCLNVCS